MLAFKKPQKKTFNLSIPKNNCKKVKSSNQLHNLWKVLYFIYFFSLPFACSSIWASFLASASTTWPSADSYSQSKEITETKQSSITIGETFNETYQSRQAA